MKTVTYGCYKTFLIINKEFITVIVFTKNRIFFFFFASGIAHSCFKNSRFVQFIGFKSNRGYKIYSFAYEIWQMKNKTRVRIFTFFCIFDIMKHKQRNRKKRNDCLVLCRCSTFSAPYFVHWVFEIIINWQFVPLLALIVPAFLKINIF